MKVEEIKLMSSKSKAFIPKKISIIVQDMADTEEEEKESMDQKKLIPLFTLNLLKNFIYGKGKMFAYNDINPMNMNLQQVPPVTIIRFLVVLLFVLVIHNFALLPD